MHSLSEASRKQHNHRSRDERRLFYICLACAQDMRNHELNLWHAHQQAIANVILIRSVISFAQFSASMLSSFIDVSLCSVDAAHMHSRNLFEQMSIFLWSRLMLLTYASHRVWRFFNTSGLECGAYAIFKVQPDVKNSFQPPAQLFQLSTSCYICAPAWCWKRGTYAHTHIRIPDG